MTQLSTRSRAQLGALLVCCSVLPLLSSCSLYNRMFHRHRDVGCTEKPFAQNTDTRPPLKAPEGMSAPDTRNAIKIPELTAAERVRAKTEPCLAQPPKFAQGKDAPTAIPGAPVTEMKLPPEAAPPPAPAAQPPGK